MSTAYAPRHRSKQLPPGSTGEEALYLRSLSERHVPVEIQLRDGERLRGWIEYFDDSMLRLTRNGEPNLFIYKNRIGAIAEVARLRASRQATTAGQERKNPR